MSCVLSELSTPVVAFDEVVAFVSLNVVTTRVGGHGGHGGHGGREGDWANGFYRRCKSPLDLHFLQSS